MKTQREIMEQRDKNEQYLLDQIEKYSGEPANKETIAWLNMCRGAYKAMCMANKKDYTAATVIPQSDEKPTRTPELDGDTEFEQVIMMIPVDVAHMTAICNIFADHMEQLAIVNRRAYDTIMLRLREVARN